IFNFSAGNLTLKVNPFAQVNGRKAYSFDIGIKTSSFFASYYSVDDRVRAYMDFEEMVPTTFTLHVKETKQLREGQMYFDMNKLQATAEIICADYCKAGKRNLPKKMARKKKNSNGIFCLTLKTFSAPFITCERFNGKTARNTHFA
ncbi:MAG: DUF3108 domain-containing protein, partial [Bdellovibrionota bacterium]